VSVIRYPPKHSFSKAHFSLLSGRIRALRSSSRGSLKTAARHLHLLRQALATGRDESLAPPFQKDSDPTPPRPLIILNPSSGPDSCWPPRLLFSIIKEGGAGEPNSDSVQSCLNSSLVPRLVQLGSKFLTKRTPCSGYTVFTSIWAVFGPWFQLGSAWFHTRTIRPGRQE